MSGIPPQYLDMQTRYRINIKYRDLNLSDKSLAWRLIPRIQYFQGLRTNFYSVFHLIFSQKIKNFGWFLPPGNVWLDWNASDTADVYHLQCGKGQRCGAWGYRRKHRHGDAGNLIRDGKRSEWFSGFRKEKLDRYFVDITKLEILIFMQEHKSYTMKTAVCSATDLRMFSDESFDVVLNMQPCEKNK